MTRALTLVAVTAALGVTPGRLDVALSSSAAGATAVTATLKLRAELQCGQPGATPLVVQLPAGETVPASLDAADVLVNGKAPAAVDVSGRRVAVTPARPDGVVCDVLAPGPIALRIGRLGNPPRAGSYAFTVQRGRATYRAAVRIAP